MSVAATALLLSSLCGTRAKAALVGNWRLDDTNSPAVCDINTNYNGALSGSVTPNQPGKIGTAFGFAGGNVKPGTSGAGNIPTASGLMTISAWVKPTAGPWTGNIAYWQNPTYIQFRVEANKALTYRQDGGHDGVVSSGGGAIPDGTWTHVAAVLNNGTGVGSVPVQLFANGVSIKSGTVSSKWLPSASSFMQIGAGAGQNFDGSIDDVAIWDTALSAGQVGTLNNILTVNGGALNDYSALHMDKLFMAYDAGAPQSVTSTVGALTWTKFTDGTGTAGSVTYDVPTQTYQAFFDSTSGVTATSSGSSAAILLIVASNGSYLDFAWNSHAGKVYDLLSATDLWTEVATWPPYNDGINPPYQDIVTSGTGSNVLSSVPPSGNPRFFAVRERNAPE